MSFPFKTHYVANLDHPLETIVRKTSRANARQLLRMMGVRICSDPLRYVNEWLLLYGNLINKHNIKGISTFSAKSFEDQLKIPGMIMVSAWREREIIGAVLFLIQGKVCYGHLAAFSTVGYKIKAFSGILWMAMSYL